MSRSSRREILTSTAALAAAAAVSSVGPHSPANAAAPLAGKEGPDMANSSWKLLRDQAAVLLVDHQDGLIANSAYPEPETVRRNTLGLVRAARVLGVPIIATTVMEGLFGHA